MKIVVNTLQAEHLSKANTSLFKKEISKITKKLKTFSEKINAVFYEPSIIGCDPQTSIILGGKIETHTDYDTILSTAEKTFKIVHRVEVKELPDSEDFDTTVLIANEHGLTLALRIPRDYYKIRYEIIVPVIILPDMTARKDNITVVYKFLRPQTTKKVMKVGNTVVVPLKRELRTIGNPKEVEVYVDPESNEIIIRPKPPS